MPDWEAEDLQNFYRLTKILVTGESQVIQNKELGNIFIDKGLAGKKGYGLLHIIEDRMKEDKNINKTAAIIHLVSIAAKEGKITREISFKNNPEHKGRVELEKDGIIAILSRQRYQGDDEKWLLTGFASDGKKEEVTEAIQTVIARYGHSLEFSGFRNQVGAVVSSPQISPQLNKKSREIEAARKAGYVQKQANIRTNTIPRTRYIKQEDNMKISDMEALIQITKEIEKQGYILHSVESEEKYIGRPTFEMKLTLSRKRILPDEPAEHINLK